jgi:peptidyl-dipeptidase Dcp
VASSLPGRNFLHICALFKAKGTGMNQEIFAPDGGSAGNPLLAEWTGPFGLPPFAPLAPEHFPPAFEQGLASHRAEIEAIAANPAVPDFDNTVAAMERSGALLTRVSNVFFVLAGADTSDALQEVERDISPLLARHNNEIYLNEALFRRIDDLHRRRDALGLNAEQKRVLDRYHTHFIRAGAALDSEKKRRLAEIGERVASLGTAFGQNVLADEKAFALVLEEGDLGGLPDFLLDAARAAAEERGFPGKHVITLSRSSYRTFPAILHPPRLAGKGAPRLAEAGREWRRNG